MRYRQYGNTGEEVSEIGFGGMRFENPKDKDAMAEIVLKSHELGVTYFDTAPFYCNDKSEAIFGLAIKEIKKSGKPFKIATKTMRPTAKEVRQDVEKSLQRLNVDAIDFYHVWCILNENQISERKAGGVLDEFRKLKEEGLIRHICVSTHLTHDKIEAMFDEAEGLFEGMLIGINALNFSMRLPGVQAAGKRGMGVATMNTLGGGMLTEHADHFKYLKREGDESMIEPALRFNLSLPEVSTALVGFRSVADVESAIAAYNRVKPLEPAALEAYQKEVIAAAEDFCTQCYYCRGCPEEIPVLRFMEAYNHRILAGENPFSAVNHLRYHWGIPNIQEVLDRCTECGKCERACTQHLPILKRFETLKADFQAVLDKEKKS